MDRPTSSLVEKIDDALSLSGKLVACGYQSVFDVIRQSRRSFTRKHRAALSISKSAAAYDMAVGLANLTSRQFRTKRLTRDIKKGLRSPERKRFSASQSDPTYENLFMDDWNSYSPTESPESTDSPVHYLAWIYRQALAFESQMASGQIIKLADRRPDLPELMIDNDAINEVIPALQLVNKILGDTIQSSLESGAVLNEVLSSSRYPNTLPFHYAHEQTLLTLENSSVSLLDVISQVDVGWPYFLQADLGGGQSQQALYLGSDLAPEQLSIVTEPPWFSTNMLSSADLASNWGDASHAIAKTNPFDSGSSFYITNYGIDPENSDQLNQPETLCNKTDLTVEQLESLLATTVGGSQAVLSSNTPVANMIFSSGQTTQTPCDPYLYGARFLNSAKSPSINFSPVEGSNDYVLNNFTDDRRDRMNRIVRLQRWLGLPFDQIDLLINSTIAAEGQNNLGLFMNSNTLRASSVFRHYRKSYGVNAYQFSALLYRITPYAISPNISLFDQVFNSPSLFEDPFSITNESFDYLAGSGPDATIKKQLCAGLGLSEAQFLILAQRVAINQGSVADHTLPCSLDVVSAFYRLTMVPRWLGLLLADGVALMSLIVIGDGTALDMLANVPPVKPSTTTEQSTISDVLDVLMALANSAEWLRTHSLSATQSYLLLQPVEELPPATTDQLNFVSSINQQLPPVLLSESTLDNSGVPMLNVDTRSDSNTGESDTEIGPASVYGDASINWMSTLSDIIDEMGLIKPIATSAEQTVFIAIYSAVLNDITGIEFDSDMPHEQIAEILSNVIYQAKLAQDGIADSALAEALRTDQSMSFFTLAWTGSSEYEFLDQTLRMQGITSTAAISGDYLKLLYEIARRAAIGRQFQLSPALLDTLLKHPDWFGLTDIALTLELLYALSRYTDWLLQAPKEDAVLAYLSWVNDPASSPPATASGAASALAALLDWDSSEVQLAAAHANGTTNIAQNLSQVDTVMRLQSLSKITGASVTPLIDIGSLTTDSDYLAWQTVGESLVATQEK